MNPPKFSIIIPFKEPNCYIYECLEHLTKQTYKDFEIILLPDGKELFKYDTIRVIPTGPMGPAEKRDIGAKKASGEILAFIDDDAYPERNWLKNSLLSFRDPEVAAVCGPGVTPPADDIFRQASGWVNALWFGSGGAGTYRFTPKNKRYVDDFPSMNFLVRREDFRNVGGFETHFWPGEDTKLCHDLVYGRKKKIIYDPSVLVYHHRKPLFLPHLQQISRFAIHRGHFARIFPKTSFRLGYLIPSLFVIFLIIGGAGSLFLAKYINFPIYALFLYFYLSVILLYLILLLVNVLYVMLKTRSISISVLTGWGIVSTHLIYGLLFPVGFLRRTLKQ